MLGWDFFSFFGGGDGVCVGWGLTPCVGKRPPCKSKGYHNQMPIKKKKFISPDIGRNLLGVSTGIKSQLKTSATWRRPNK